MRQRVMIAIALACGPRLLFADEPTTALDVTVQAQILDLLQAQQTERHMAMVLITHDLGVVAGRADDIAVMYAGKVVEKAPTNVLFSSTRHPYTEALLKSIPKLEHTSHTRLAVIPGRPPDLVSPPEGCNFSPRCPYAQPKCFVEEPVLEPGPGGGHEFACWFPVGTPRGRRGPRRQREGRRRERWSRLMAGTGTAHLRDPSETILRAEDLVVEFPVGRTGLKVHAVSGISLDVMEGETLGLVGESGCGKSTTGPGPHAVPQSDRRQGHLRG